VRWLNERSLWEELAKSCIFFNTIKEHIIRVGKGYIENPIPHKYARTVIGKYNQIIQPYQFGEAESKATCLWLIGLDNLKETNRLKKWNQSTWKMAPGKNRKENRSKTFKGIAEAMAEQWS